MSQETRDGAIHAAEAAGPGELKALYDFSRCHPLLKDIVKLPTPASTGCTPRRPSP
ncbi:hypothetical protein N7U49_04505 [Streptomyces sp. AD2-2]|nr:hypothetical protein N7U49_04505 [Streptomyces sp. AD2-2]